MEVSEAIQAFIMCHEFAVWSSGFLLHVCDAALTHSQMQVENFHPVFDYTVLPFAACLKNIFRLIFCDRHISMFLQIYMMTMA